MNNLQRCGLTRTFGLLSLLALSGLAGCAAIVGADDYQVGIAEGTAGSGIGGGTGQGGVGSGVDGDAMNASGAAGSRIVSDGSAGTGRFSDASMVDDVVVKESSVTPPTSDTGRADVVVPDAGPGGKPLGSGETQCTTSCTGAGLTCQHTALGPSGLCTYLCADATACDANHDCIGSSVAANKFDYACLKKCPNNACGTGQTCYPLAMVGPICIPTDWLTKNLGLGDDCAADAQCTSGQCVNKPNGWCSRPCQALDLCAGDYTDGKNYYDEFNWCMNVLGGYKCTPGCTGSASDCLNYPGTTCKPKTDIDGYSTNVCIP